MPSFDVVSEVEMAELDNALSQAHKEIDNRYDLKQSKSEVTKEKKDGEILIVSQDDFTLGQVLDVLRNKMSKRGIPLENVRMGKIEPASDGRVKQTMTIQQGVPQETCKRMVKDIKAEKFKVQASIQGDQLRVSGKKRDDLQEVIAFLRKQQEAYEIALQFTNFRD